MTDREKVIKGLECLITNEVPCDGCPYNEGENSSCLRNIANDALELLKEQEPVAPKKQEETRIWTVCGNCSQHLISKWTYCPYCGQAVRWDE